jgi:ubiquinone/menaquinone biosynthesis C-methylase UbiE
MAGASGDAGRAGPRRRPERQGRDSASGMRVDVSASRSLVLASVDDLNELRATWDELGRDDPLWAVLSTPQTRGNRWQPEEFFATGRLEIEQLMVRLKALGIDVHPQRCLDFGCGVGRLSRALSEHFERVDGVDIAASMVERARQFNGHIEGCVFTVNSERDLRLFGDETFDLIYTRLVLMHMKPRFSRAYITEFIRVLKPGGVAVFHLPSRRPARKQILYSLAMARRTLRRRARRWTGAEPGPLPSDYRHLMFPVRKATVQRLVRRAGATLVTMDESEAADALHDVMYYAVRTPH